jgi:hypothetical protein
LGGQPRQTVLEQSSRVPVLQVQRTEFKLPVPQKKKRKKKRAIWLEAWLKESSTCLASLKP